MLNPTRYSENSLQRSYNSSAQVPQRKVDVLSHIRTALLSILIVISTSNSYAKESSIGEIKKSTLEYSHSESSKVNNPFHNPNKSSLVTVKHVQASQQENSLANKVIIPISQYASNLEHSQNSTQDSYMSNPIPLEYEESLQIYLIPLKYTQAKEIVESLTQGQGNLLSGQGGISYNARSNMLIIRETPSRYNELLTVIQQLDIPSEQVIIEARIVTISDKNLKELGVRWGLFEPQDGSYPLNSSLNANGFTTKSGDLMVNLASTAPTSSIAFQLAKINGRLLDLELSALEEERNVTIIASPRLLTTNKQSASIKQGTEIPYVVTDTESNTQSVTFRDAVLGLEVTPHIDHDKNILMELIVSQNSPGSSVNYGDNQMTTIDKQEIRTQVFAKSGETIVLGGVFHDTSFEGESQVPLLGNVPVVGQLFSNSTKQFEKRELVIFVTPHIIQHGVKSNKQLVKQAIATFQYVYDK